ncbi:MAG: methyl-accepting chemotaxis protein [Woeseiaceae bacterium]|nr:methyl-accepting chemotaxis protein [Woeseiaceae bacterium]
MANKTDNSSIFRLLAGLALLLLVVSAALVYLQAGSGGSEGQQLAALSQAIPTHANRALAGDANAFNDLDQSLKRVASLRRAAGPATPGPSADWQAFENSAAAILAKRSDAESFNDGVDQVVTSAAAMLTDAELLFDYTGATALVQEFQQRADRVRQAAAGAASSSDVTTTTAAIAEDVQFLRGVIDAFAGEDSDIDVRALNDEGLQVALMPLAGSLQVMEEGAGSMTASAPQVNGLSATLAELASSADKLLGSAFGTSGSSGMLPGFLNTAWVPIGLLLLAVLLVAGLLVVHAKSSHFEETAKVQAEQNERNQQAILRLLDEMGSLADGDLTVEATVTEDITGTIADSFNYAIEELRKLVATVNETAIMVDSAAKQTENTAAHMAKAAENQTREISAATESIVSMAGSIEEVSGNAERSSDVARHSVEVAHKGGEAVRRTIDGMNAIRETIQETSKRIKRLGESSQEIGNIVELINDIAEQTNILALNASIQASMAGEAGRGFAVVADEVQRLAERSTNATKQIEVLVRTIQADTNEAVVSMERSTTDVVGGALLAENAGAALDEIEQVSNQIANLVQNISGSARQQAGSAADVTRRTTRLGEISEQTGKAASATAAAISKLAELATQLRTSVAGFTLPAEMMQASALKPGPRPVPPPVAANDQVSAG